MVAGQLADLPVLLGGKSARDVTPGTASPVQFVLAALVSISVGFLLLREPAEKSVD